MNKKGIIIALIVMVFGLVGYILLLTQEIEKSPNPLVQKSELLSENGTVKINTSKKSRLVIRPVLSNGNITALVNLDGTNQKTLPEYLLYSVDAFNTLVTEAAANHTISVLDSEGNLTKVISFENINDLSGIPVLSPDRVKAVYLKIDSKTTHHQLWIEDVATKTEKILYDNLEQFGADGEFKYIQPFAYSADSQKVYLEYKQSSVQSYSGLQKGIFIFDVASKKMKSIHLSDNNIDQILLSPDHTKLAVLDSNPNSAIYFYDFTTGKETTNQVGQYNGSSQSFAWSPDSTKFAYVTYTGIDKYDDKGILQYITVADGSVHVLGVPNQGVAQMFWLNQKDILYNYQIYGNYGNGQYWKFGTVLFDSESRVQTESLKDVNLVAVIPE
jgi:hypothetical protein